MARSVVEQLPSKTRKWLEVELRERGFSGYTELTDALNARLLEDGLELRVSRSGLHRWGKKIEERIAAVRDTTEAALQIRELSGDDEGALTDSLVRLIQDKLFHTVIDLEVQPEKADIYKLGRVIAELAKASVAQKKWMAEYRRSLEKQLDEIARDATDAQDAVQRLRAAIYGSEP